MKISRTRQGFSLPEYIAYAGLSRAVRAFKRADRFAVAIIISKWEEKGTYLRAATAHLNPRGDFRITDRVYVGDLKEETYDTILDDLANKKTIVLYKDEEDIPDEISVAFDAVVHVDAPTTRQVRGVVKWLHGIDITPDQAGVLARSNWRRLKLAVMRGRPMSRVLTMLQKIEALRAAEEGGGTKIAWVTANPSDATLEEMAGYGDAKDWGLDLARDISDWRAGKLSWDDVDKGILLSGPPGVGKTIFSRALAATCNMELVVASYARWQAKGHLGDFLKAMLASFSDAKKKAPAILFIDELDAFGDRSSRGSDNDSYDIKATNGLLEQLDGLDGREGVVVVGACNHPEWIDAAITRPGRLDRHIRIPLPDAEARAAIFRMHLRGRFSDVEHKAFADATEGMAGAAIEQIVREARRTARRRNGRLTSEDVFRHVPPLVVIPPNVVRVNAIHEIGHSVVGVTLGMDLESVSISRTIRFAQHRQAVGKAVFKRDHWTRRTKEHYLDLIAMTVGGMAAEQLVLGCWDDGAAGGAGSDLHEATKTAIALERSFGMGQKLASFGSIDDRLGSDLKSADVALMAQVDTIIRGQLDRAMVILERHREACIQLVDELVERGQLPGREVLDALEQNEDGDIVKFARGP